MSELHCEGAEILCGTLKFPLLAQLFALMLVTDYIFNLFTGVVFVTPARI